MIHKKAMNEESDESCAATMYVLCRVSVQSVRTILNAERIGVLRVFIICTLCMCMLASVNCLVRRRNTYARE